jgi:hypothetical protein
MLLIKITIEHCSYFSKIFNRIRLWFREHLNERERERESETLSNSINWSNLFLGGFYSLKNVLLL